MAALCTTLDSMADANTTPFKPRTSTIKIQLPAERRSRSPRDSLSDDEILTDSASWSFAQLDGSHDVKPNPCARNYSVSSTLSAFSDSNTWSDIEDGDDDNTSELETPPNAADEWFTRVVKTKDHIPNLHSIYTSEPDTTTRDDGDWLTTIAKTKDYTPCFHTTFATAWNDGPKRQMQRQERIAKLHGEHTEAKDTDIVKSTCFIPRTLDTHQSFHWGHQVNQMNAQAKHATIEELAQIPDPASEIIKSTDLSSMLTDTFSRFSWPNQLKQTNKQRELVGQTDDEDIKLVANTIVKTQMLAPCGFDTFTRFLVKPVKGRSEL